MQALRRQAKKFLGEQPATGLRASHWLPDGGARTAFLEAAKVKPDAALPIQVFRCGAPAGDRARFSSTLGQQIDRALADAREHGFTPAPVRVVPGADHGPLEAPVMAWFDSLAQRQAGPTGSR